MFMLILGGVLLLGGGRAFALGLRQGPGGVNWRIVLALTLFGFGVALAGGGAAEVGGVDPQQAARAW